MNAAVRLGFALPWGYAGSNCRPDCGPGQSPGGAGSEPWYRNISAPIALIASQLYGVGITDPLTIVGVPVLLLSIAVIASAIPALRAMRVSPVQALRHD